MEPPRVKIEMNTGGVFCAHCQRRRVFAADSADVGPYMCIIKTIVAYVSENGGHYELSGGLQKTGKIRTASCAEVL